VAAIDNAARRRTPAPPHGSHVQLECRDRDGEGPDAGLWLAHEESQLVGYAALILNRFVKQR
jgi:hypothetical protein